MRAEEGLKWVYSKEREEKRGKGGKGRMNKLGGPEEEVSGKLVVVKVKEKLEAMQ